MRISRQAGLAFAPKTLFWVALLLVFAQVAHAFDSCATHLENTRQGTMIVKAPCVAGYVCENCTVAPVKDVCDSVSEFAVRTASVQLTAPPLVIVDMLFIASPVPAPETPTTLPLHRGSSDVPLRRSLYRAPQLSGRAPPPV